MHDLVVRNAFVVDGTGQPGRPGDLAVTAGRITSIGSVIGTARRTIDAGGLVLAPGFVDVHTHYDAQVFWDPTLTPSPQHGVTTVVAGNCGFSIAPLPAGDAEARDYLMRMLARVEGMPLESLETGVPWDWASSAEYLDRVDGRTVPNVGFMVGHSAVRVAAMGTRAWTDQASDRDLAAMRGLVKSALHAGALGFSSTWSPSHNDHFGGPVPSRVATEDELVTLAGVVGDLPGTSLEFIPALGAVHDDNARLMAAMSVAAGRPLNWNVLVVYGKNGQLVDKQLAASDHAATVGGRVVALTLPDSMRLRLNFRTGFLLDSLPGWDVAMALPEADKLALLRDAAGRSQLNQQAQTQTGTMRSLANWGAYEIVDVGMPELRPLVGRTVADVARERGTSEWDALADLVVSDRLATVIAAPDKGQDDASWNARVRSWRDSRTVVGASDAGAHLDMIDSFAFATTLLEQAVRRRSLIPIEEAVMYLTSQPADLYGLVDRGVLREGAHGDLVLLDPDAISAGPHSTRYDLPAGAGRIHREAQGIESVFVAGQEVVHRGELTEARPGRVLRRGLDTVTPSLTG